jgi:hypothetical protein
MRTAAALLAAVSGGESLASVVLATGLAAAPEPLDSATRESLGLADSDRASLAAGAGSIRVLIFESRATEPLRDSLIRLSRRLNSRAPHVLWLVASVDADAAHAAIIAWSGGAKSPRVASFLWEPAHVVDSDAETLCALAAILDEADVTIHARCLDVLGRESLTRRFYRVLESHVGELAQSLPTVVERVEARELALLCVSRLLFLRFLEAKGWLNGEREFIGARFDECMTRGGGFHRRVLLPLFFGTLNTPFTRRAARAREFGRVPFLNGGLFARTALERRTGAHRFPDSTMGALLQNVFQRFRFAAQEDSASWSEASIDPEMLGRAFESLMASGERRSGGVFYTPHELVTRVAEHALEGATRERDPKVLRSFRVLDPACGSGAFLVYVLERLAGLRQQLGEPGTLATLRRDALARSIFGVDRNPTAVWLCELRLWLSVVIESDDGDPMRVPPLPNLDRNIRVGDALAGPAFDGNRILEATNLRVADLRARYLRATGARKFSLARTLDRAERRRALEQVDRLLLAASHARNELAASQQARDLFGERRPPTAQARRELTQLRDVVRRHRAERRRIADGGALPFLFGAFFGEAQAAGGFDVVLGNPPWVRLHRIPQDMRARLRDTYEVYQRAHWQSGARLARAAPGFASQIDLSALFVERSLKLLRTDGTLSLLLPAKLWRSLAGGGVRELLTNRSCMRRLEDVAESKHPFDAVVYPSLLVATSRPPHGQPVTVGLHDRRGERTWASTLERLAYDDTPGAPWILLPPDARGAFERIRSAGRPLAATPFGAPRLGVKSGCNAAFLVRVASAARGIATVTDASGETGSVECALLRPALRGDAVRPWHPLANDMCVIWTHGASGAPLERLPDRAAAWLQRYYGPLASRSDATGARRWWSLFRVDAADATAARVVWADFGKRPRALVLDAGDPTVPLNTCYVVRCANATDAWALAALLNSRVAAAWLNAIAEPARGGYRRYLGWTVGQLPLPAAWDRARQSLALAGMHAAGTADTQGSDALELAVLAAFGLEYSDVAPLLNESTCE